MYSSKTWTLKKTPSPAAPISSRCCSKRRSPCQRKKKWSIAFSHSVKVVLVYVSASLINRMILIMTGWKRTNINNIVELCEEHWQSRAPVPTAEMLVFLCLLLRKFWKADTLKASVCRTWQKHKNNKKCCLSGSVLCQTGSIFLTTYKVTDSSETLRKHVVTWSEHQIKPRENGWKRAEMSKKSKLVRFGSRRSKVRVSALRPCRVSL